MCAGVTSPRCQPSWRLETPGHSLCSHNSSGRPSRMPSPTAGYSEILHSNFGNSVQVIFLRQISALIQWQKVYFTHNLDQKSLHGEFKENFRIESIRIKIKNPSEK